MSIGKAAVVMFATAAMLPFAIAQQTTNTVDARSMAGATASNPMAATISRDAVYAADPRQCLEFSDNWQIIMCAEKYRPHKRRS